MKILLIENELLLAGSIAGYLQSRGLPCEWAKGLASAPAIIKENSRAQGLEDLLCLSRPFFQFTLNFKLFSKSALTFVLSFKS